MVRVTHAVLHVFDLDTGSCQLSAHELDLSERAVGTYVRRMMQKASANPDNGPATLDAGSALAPELARYVVGARNLVDLSQDIARTLWEQLRASEDAVPCDLLVADFTNTEKARAASGQVDPGQTDPGQMTPPWDEGDGPIIEVPKAADDPEDRTRRFLGIALLPRRKAFVHELGEFDGSLASGLATNDATLPNPTQRITQYALVDVDTLEAEVVDAGVQIGGRPVRVLADVLLACKPAPSTREVVDAVVRIAGELAEDAGRSASIAMADAKDYVTHAAQQHEAVTPEAVGERVFADEPELVDRYVEAVRDEGLPEEVQVRPSVANRLAKSHRIRTDTGIDITFPSAYAADQHFIEFGRDADGGIQIVIHAASIENR